MSGEEPAQFFLRISALTWKPWISINKTENGTYISGPMANILKILSKEMKFSYDIYMPEDREWGMKRPNGSWSGMIGMIYSNESDVALGPFATTYDRSKVATFTPSLASGYLAIMAGRMKKNTANVFGYIVTFDWQVWLMLIVTMVVMVMVSFLIDVVTDPRYRLKTIAVNRIKEHFWNFFASIFCEASSNLPETTSGRLLVGVWWLGIIVLMNAFSGHLKAAMTVKHDFDKIISWKDLAEKPDIVPFVWKGTAYEDYLKNADWPDVKKIWKTVSEHNSRVGPSVLYRPENLRGLQHGRNVIISDTITMKYIMFKECSRITDGEFYLVKEVLFPHNFVMLMRKELSETIKNGIIQRIRWMVEAGMVNNWLEKMNGHYTNSLNHNIGDQTRALEIADLWAIFILWAICILVATATFVVELLYYNFCRSSKKIH